MRMVAAIVWGLGGLFAGSAWVRFHEGALLFVAGLALVGAIVIFRGGEAGRGIALVGAGVGAVGGLAAAFVAYLAVTMCPHCDNFWISLAWPYLLIGSFINGQAAREMRLASEGRAKLA